MRYLTDKQAAEVAVIAAAAAVKVGDKSEWYISWEGDHWGCLHRGDQCLGNVVGPMGPSGGSGPMGPVGPAGPAASDGPMGPEGPQGPMGPQGPAGEKGDTGPQGPQGIQGPQGDVGPQGIQGPQGDTGPTGATGPKGDTGPQGPQGLKGDTGPQGPQGIQGLMGATGPKGDTGPAGAVSLYTSGGIVSGSPKVWVGAVNPNSSGIWTVDYSSAGFASPPHVMVCSANLGDQPADRNFASVNTLSITTTGCNGGVSNAVTTGLLVATVLVNASTSTPVLIMAIGV